MSSPSENIKKSSDIEISRKVKKYLSRKSPLSQLVCCVYIDELGISLFLQVAQFQN